MCVGGRGGWNIVFVIQVTIFKNIQLTQLIVREESGSFTQQRRAFPGKSSLAPFACLYTQKFMHARVCFRIFQILPFVQNLQQSD